MMHKNVGSREGWGLIHLFNLQLSDEPLFVKLGLAIWKLKNFTDPWRFITLAPPPLKVTKHRFSIHFVPEAVGEAEVDQRPDFFSVGGYSWSLALLAWMANKPLGHFLSFWAILVFWATLAFWAPLAFWAILAFGGILAFKAFLTVGPRSERVDRDQM